MKKKLLFLWALPVYLILFVLVLDNLFPGKTAQAAGPCSANEFHTGSISADESWCTGTHYLNGDVTVQAGATLTIQPGVTLAQTGDAFWKYLIIRGHLDVLGTADQPVIMKNYVYQSDTPWAGIFFDGSAGDGSGTINYATIERAGSNLLPDGCVDDRCGNAQTAIFVKDLAAGKLVSINHSLILNNVGKGLFVVDSTVNVNNTNFSQNKYPIYINGASSVVTYSGNSFSENMYPYYENRGNYFVPEDSIFISTGALMGHDFSLPTQSGLDAYVFLQGTTIPAGRSLTIDPGTTVRTGTGSLTVKGQLNAAGSAAQPIKISGIPDMDNLPIEWFGLAFDGRDGGGTGHLDYVTIEKGADNLAEYGPYALLVRNTPAEGQVLVEHSTVQDNRGFGVRVVDGKLTLSNSTLARNNWPIQIEGAASQVPLSGVTFTANTKDYVYLVPPAMTNHDINLTRQTGLSAYYFTGAFTLPTGSTMTVQPGLTLRMAGNNFLIIQGDLQAVGSAGQPIRFTTQEEGVGTWGGLIFDGPAGASGHLDHAIVERGCAFWNNLICSTMTIYNLAANKSVIVENSTLQDSADFVLSIINSATAQVNANLIIGGRNGVYVGSNITLQNLAIINQALDGVTVETGNTLDARHLTIARAGRSGLYIHTGGTGSLKNSILANNALAVWVEGSGQAQLDTNLADANTNFKNRTVVETNTFYGSAAFEADGYHIQNTSAATWKGLAGLSSVDIDQDPRPTTPWSRPDLGADQVSISWYAVFLPITTR